MVRVLLHEHWGESRPDRRAEIYLVEDIEDHYEVDFYENDERIESRTYYKKSRSWGESVAEDAAENWCLVYIP